VQLSALSFVFLFVIFFVMTFNRLTMKYHQMTNQVAIVEKQYIALKATHSSLETQVALATSDETVRKWAYEDAHLVRNGDIPIVPLSPAKVTPTPRPVLRTVPARSVQPWRVWWELFFGDK